MRLGDATPILILEAYKRQCYVYYTRSPEKASRGISLFGGQVMQVRRHGQGECRGGWSQPKMLRMAGGFSRREKMSAKEKKGSSFWKALNAGLQEFVLKGN